MRKVVMGMMTTLNGRLDDPDQWVTGVPGDLYAELDRLYGTSDTILVGRTTYEEMLEYWPGADFVNDLKARAGGDIHLAGGAGWRRHSSASAWWTSSTSSCTRSSPRERNGSTGSTSSAGWNC